MVTFAPIKGVPFELYRYENIKYNKVKDEKEDSVQSRLQRYVAEFG